MVPHGQRRGVLVCRHPHLDVVAAAGSDRCVVDRVGDQVAHDALDPSYVGLGDARPVGDHPHLDAALERERLGRADHPVGDVDQVDVLQVEHRRARVEPTDLQQVGEQGLEPVELALQQLGGPRRHRVEPVALVVQHVAGHAHGRQRGAELVGDVGHELALHPRELLELPDLALEGVGHLVERRAQPGDVVLADDVHALLEPARRDPLGDPPGQPDRGHHLSRDQPAQAGQQHQEQDAGRDQGVLEQAEGVALLGHREDQVERVVAPSAGSTIWLPTTTPGTSSWGCPGR